MTDNFNEVGKVGHFNESELIQWELNIQEKLLRKEEVASYKHEEKERMVLARRERA